MEKKNILILGGEGFIGRNIAEFLSSEKYSCSSVGVEESIFSENRKDELKKINPYDCKIENDFDVAIHLIDNRAAEGEDFADAEKKLIENIGLKSKKHLILFSSAVIYANPDSEYGKRKIELERI
ncbi:MAG: NAD-dependent epimerase/dehydratase family protein, partial [Candidatus Moranbacteria bacterium]|nr:NAD-dependent epimerase/dehydratase family protein [Candidatus Moranbacteria bacterium]